MSPSAHTRVRHLYQIASWTAFALTILYAIDLFWTLLMLAVEAFEWSRLCIAGLCSICAALAWLVGAELANSQPDQN
jgi:hypothetical protein